MSQISSQLITIGQQARNVSHQLRLLDSEKKKQALLNIAAEIRKSESTLLHANALDLERAKTAGLSLAFLDRLTLNAKRIQSMAEGVAAIADLPEPCGRVLAEWDRPNGLHIRRVSVPLGVIGVIYESRPNVTADAAALCLKAGNAVILRGGSDSFETSAAIMAAIHKGLILSKLPSAAVQMIPSTERQLVNQMLKMDRYIDVIIPRGGIQLVQMIRENSRIPLFEHLQGICHTYLHQDADLDLSRRVVINAKLRRPGICGATETLLIDHAVLQSKGLTVIQDLLDQGCEVRGDESCNALDSRIKKAAPEDWDTEYLDRIINVKAVTSIDDAISHINEHGSHHTDAILTEDEKAARYFMDRVDSAIVMHNTSTQFADGGEFGMGAEIGIATGKLHARGPVGIEQLTTFHYEVLGQGQIRPVA